MADSRLNDPLNREIVLYERTWIAHILKGHPEVAPYRELVEQAVTAPTEIRHSSTSRAAASTMDLGRARRL